MALKVADRIYETSTTTGTGNITLAGAVSSYRAFSAVCANNDTVYYVIRHQTANEYEVGLGTWTTGGILVRTTVLVSSNANALVTFSAGTKDVFSPGVPAAAFPLAAAFGGTGQSSYTDGQLLIGNTSTGGLTKATLTAGANITITNAGGSITIAATSGGGLTNFTESVNTSSPNVTVPVVRLLATYAATDVDVALTPKGGGALTAQVADGTATGGNKRGGNAVDWQTIRSASTNVASGVTSTVSGGKSNTASGTSSTVSGGQSNTASASYSNVNGGQGNTASGYNSTVCGGLINTANGYVQIVCGQYNTILPTSANTSAFSSTDPALIIGNGDGATQAGRSYSMLATFDSKLYLGGRWTTSDATGTQSKTGYLNLGFANSTNFAQITAASHSASRTYTFIDVGSNANIVTDAGNYTMGGSLSFTGITTIGGGLRISVQALKVANYTVTIFDQYVAADATSGAITLTMPSTPGSGQHVTLVKTDASANAVTINMGGNALVGGATSLSLSTQGSTYTLLYDNLLTKWIIVGSH